MKIAYLARRPIPSVNANSVQIVKMCEALGSLGHKVTLFATPGDAPSRTVFGRYGVKRSFRIRTLARLRGPFSRRRFVISLFTQPAFLRADIMFGRDISSLAAAARLGKPVIYEVHTLPPPGTNRWHLLGRLLASPNFSHLVCVTSTLAAACREQFPVLADKLVMVEPNAAAEPYSDEVVQNWPGRADSIQVGFVGRPFPGKGIELMAEAASALPQTDFHVVGAHPTDLHWMPGSLPPNLHFHGYQPHGRLAAVYRHFDIAVAPYGDRVFNASGKESATHTSPLKLLEYLAAGLPVIVSDLPGVRDILKGEEVALLAPPGNADAFVQAVTRLAGDEQLRATLARAAREHYLAHYTVEARARRVLEPVLQAQR